MLDSQTSQAVDGFAGSWRFQASAVSNCVEIHDTTATTHDIQQISTAIVPEIPLQMVHSSGVESGLGSRLSHRGDLPHRGRTPRRTHFVWPELHLWHSGHHFREAGALGLLQFPAKH